MEQSPLHWAIPDTASLLVDTPEYVVFSLPYVGDTSPMYYGWCRLCPYVTGKDSSRTSAEARVTAHLADKAHA